MADSRVPRVVAGGVVILLAALLYLATLDTGLRPDELAGGDLITHQYAQVQARPSNAPGYPLYTVGGWLWFRITGPLLGWALNPVQRLASYSTLWALLSLGILYALVLRTTRANWIVAALSTGFYATTYFFWFYSVTTEQYTSAVFQTLLIVWLAFAWDDAETQGRPSERYLLWLAFVVGTCIANLVTTLFIVPPLLWFVLSRRRDLLRRPRLALLCGALVLLPALSYVYVYARGAAHPEWRGAGQWPSAWAWFVHFLTTQQGRDELSPGLTLSRLVTDEFPALVWGELTLAVLIGGLLGIGWLGRRRAIFLTSTLAIYFAFCWVDRFGNWFQVLIPAYPLIILGFAAGLNALWSRDWASDRWRLAVRSLIGLALSVLLVYRLATSLPRADQSNRPEDTGLNPGWAVLADQPEPGAVIVADYDEWLALQYLTDVWGARPLIYPRPLCRPDLPETPGARHPSAPASALYLTRQAAAADAGCLADQPRYAAGSTLIRVEALPNTRLPETARPASLAFGPELSLIGFGVGPLPEPGPGSSVWAGAGLTDGPGSPWRLALYWRANVDMDQDYTMSVRPLRGGNLIPGADGQPLIQDHQPVWNSYPTSRWSPGEVVRDDFVFTLPDQALPDTARIVVYRITAEGFENLAEADLVLAP